MTDDAELKKAGLKVTLPRLRILELLEDGDKAHLSAEEIYRRLIDAGEESGDQVWRFPLSKSYDKLINSKFADMKNIGMGGAGSITAAQFLQRFVNKVPWAHLDIAGMAFSKYGGALNSGGATGYGVRLLNKLIEDHYE